MLNNAAVLELLLRKASREQNLILADLDSAARHGIPTGYLEGKLRRTRGEIKACSQHLAEELGLPYEEPAADTTSQWGSLGDRRNPPVLSSAVMQPDERRRWPWGGSVPS